MEQYDDGLEMGVPAAYYDTWNRHNSIAFSNYKGLRNAPGENNCFLNSAVQVFWHLDVFRRSYRRLTGHSCMGNSCIFCALKATFTQFQYSDQSSLPPDALRKALAETFVDQHRYQIGHMDDAAECFENILRRLHLHVASEHNEDTCTAAHCISHQKFAMTVFDQLVCPCGAKTDPLRFHELVHYVSASALVSQAKQNQATGDILHPDRFGLLLRNAAAMGDIRNCPSNCGKSVQMRRTLLNLPDVVSIGLIWDSERPNGEVVTDVIRSLGTTIMLQDVFHSVMSEDGSRLPKLTLSAVVCYYGKHYSTFVFNTKLKVWIYFDDATVREIGPNWEDVVQKCVRSRYQPLLLIYTNPYPTLLPVQTAPQRTTMHPGYKMTTQVSPEAPKQKRGDSRAAFAQQRAALGRRAITPGPEMTGSSDEVEPQVRRAITPGPEHYSYEPERDGVRRGAMEHSRHDSFLVAMTERPDPSRNTSHYNADPCQDQALIGEYVYNNGHIQPSFKQPSYGTDSHDSNIYQTQNISPSFGIVNQNHDIQRKESFKKGTKAHGDVIRYMVDQQLQNPTDTRKARSGKGRHTRSRSQSYEDTLSVSSDTNPHVASTKSKPNAYNMDNGQAVHGPVQSGLATLPRKKGDQRKCKTPSPSTILDSTDQSHERQGSASSSGSVVLNPKFQQVPVNSSRGEYMDQKHFIRKPEAAVPHCRSSETIPNNPNIHWRQVSGCSQSSQSTLTPSDPTYHGISHSHQSSVSSQISNHPHHGRPRVILPGGAPPGNSPSTDPASKDYISSNMVQKILSKQRVQRQASSASSHSVRSNTSNSSVESDISLQKHLKAKSGKDSLTVEIPYDNLSLESQKDSGYSGSDRNSSSSSGSVTMDPFSQYFISRSMIPPKSVNDYAFMHNFTESFKESLANMKKKDIEDSPYEPMNFNGPPPNDYTVNYVQQQQQLSQKGLNQNMTTNISNSQWDRDQMENNKNIQKPRKTKSSSTAPDNSHILANSRDYKNSKPNTDQRVPHTDSSDLINFKSGIQVQDILPGYSEAASKSVTSDEFSGLCHKAEEMMDRCMLCETSGQITDAVNSCNAAISYLKEAMKMSNVSQQSFIFAQCKHNSCIMKHRSLLKQAQLSSDGNMSSASSETLNSLSANRSSMTSTDSDGSQRDLIHLDSQGRVEKDVFKNKLQDLYQQGMKPSSQPQGRVAGRQPGVKPPPPQRGVSIGSKSIPVNHSNPSCQNSSMNTTTTSSVNKHSNIVPGDKLTGNSYNGQNSRSQVIDNQSRDAELYQTYLNRQRSLAAGMKSGQSSSGTSTPTSSLDGSDGGRDMPPGTYMGKSYSKAEIRHMLQQNMIHRQHPQSVAPVRVQQQSGPPQAYSGATNPRAASFPQDTTVRSGINPPVIAQKPSVPPVCSKPKIACKPVRSGDSKPGFASVTRMQPIQYQPQANNTRSLERRMSQPVYNQHYGACSSEHNYLTQSSQLARDKTAWSTYSSQPDLSSSGVETDNPSFPPPGSLSAPSTPAHSSENLQDIDCKPSVKDIASRFETTSISAPRAGRRSMEPEGECQTPQRQRSKSESSSGPRTVLKKKKKVKPRSARKSVTFSDSIALIAAAEELPPGPAPPPYEEAISARGQDRLGWEDSDTYYGYDSDDDIVKVVPAGYHDDDFCDKDSLGSSESPVESGEVMCSLCRKKGAEPNVSYCSNCSYYMSRFQPNR